MAKLVASLSLDLDNEWSYLKTHGDAAWRSFPSYLDLVVPRFLEFLERRGLRITVFIVGQDAELDRNRRALRAVADAGHEIGNHSFHHEPWLHTYSATQIASEIARAAEAIENATGRRPVGFRGPGYSLSRATLEALASGGYRYDCSTLPTYIGPLARAYYFMTAKLTPDEREQRRLLFGSVAEGLRPLRPYEWNLGAKRLIEVPVTTFPVIKVPIHFSYLLYVALTSPALALAYFRCALFACRMLGIAPSLLLHPLDFLDGEDVATLSFFPAMRLRRARKLDLLDRAVEAFQGAFEVGSVGEHAAATVRAGPLRAMMPRFG